MKLINAMVTVGGLTGLSRVAGFVRDILIAKYMGAGPVADAFFVALKLPNFFRRVTAEGAFSVSFVPLYSGMLGKEGEARAEEFAGRAFAIMLTWLTVFTMIVLAAMPWVIYAIAPGFEAGTERYDLAVEMSRISFPYLLFISLTALLGGVMNAHDRFAPFAAAPILFNMGMLVFLLCHDKFQTPGHALSWGIAAAGVMQLAFLVLCMKRAGIRIKISMPKMDDDIRKLLRLMGPGLIGAGVVHINLFADMIIASFLPEGSISYLYYGDRLNQLPLGIVGVAVGTALLPMLSRAVAAGHEVEAKHLFNRALEVCLVLALPAGLALFVGAKPIISVLFERGEFSAADSVATAYVLMGYALGLPAYVAVKVLSGAFWARQDTMSPVRVGIKAAAVNIVLAIILSRFMGVTGIALATGIAGWVQFTLLFRGLKDKPAVQFDDRLRWVFPRILLACGLMAAVVIAVQFALGGWFEGESSLKRLIALAVLIGGGGGIYALTIMMTGALTWGDLRKYFKRKELTKEIEGQAL